ncbi:MAG: PEGA domain-containing protein [Myxococcales bacterium]|jgi:tetratricopeptide (TPR) repeat protein|nr:PEGA domain-containing protein [Myxococcales bacterium]
MRRAIGTWCVVFAVSTSSVAHGQEVGPPLAAEGDAGAHPETSPDADAAGRTEPSAEVRKEASERFQRGMRLYAEGEHNLALIEFERAYQLVSDYRGLYNIAQVAISLGRFARARVALETYLAEGKDQLPEKRKQEVEADLEMLRGRTAHLSIRVEPTGAEVLVDDVVVGTSPLEAPLLLDAGEHRVVVRKPRYVPQTQRVVLAGAEEIPLEVTLVPEETEQPVVIVRDPDPPVVRPPPPTPVPDVGSPGIDPASIAWTSAAALAGGALVTGIVGLTAANEHAELMGRPDVSIAERDRLASKANDFFLATDILVASAAVAAGVGLYFTLIENGKEKPEARRAAGRSLELRAAGSRVSLSGRF